jgi:hypothetical protein
MKRLRVGGIRMNRFTFDEYEHRWNSLTAALREQDDELALVWGKTAGSYERSGDLLYLTNFYSTQSGQEPDSPVWNACSFAATLVAPNETPELHVDDMSPDRVFSHFDVIDGVARALKQRPPTGRVAVVGSDFLPVKYANQLIATCPSIDFVHDDDLVRSLRRIKVPPNSIAFERQAPCAPKRSMC